MYRGLLTFGQGAFYSVRMDNLSPRIAAEVGDVERHNLLNIVCAHRGDKTSVVNLTPTTRC